jgi:RND family efflux transporter MFP subunit
VVLTSESVEVAAPREGRLAAVHVRLGDRVQKGALLATLDRHALRSDQTMAKASRSAAQAEVHRAALELEQARQRLARVLSLTEGPGTPAVSGDEVDKAHYQEKTAAAHLEEVTAALAERGANLQRTAVALEETRVRAPFDGTIVSRYVDDGAIVHAGTPILHLINDGELLVRFAVPESDAAALQVGRGVRIEAAAPTAGARAFGIIEKMAPEVDAASRMIVLEARLGRGYAEQGHLLSGQVIRVVVLPPAKRPSAACVRACDLPLRT